MTIRTNSNCCITDSWNLFRWQPHFWYFHRPNIDVWLMRYAAGSDSYFRVISQVLLSLPVHCKFGTCNYVMKQTCTQWHNYLREEECTDGERGREGINTQQTKAKETGREGLKRIIPSRTGAKNVLPQTPYN